MPERSMKIPGLDHPIEIQPNGSRVVVTAGGIAKAAIGKADAVSFDELRRRGLVIVLGH